MAASDHNGYASLEKPALTLRIDIGSAAVSFTAIATNKSATPITLRFPNSARLQVLVKNAAGETLWDSTAGKFFAMAIGSVTIEPGKSVQYSADWHPADSAHGHLTAQAIIRSTPPLSSKPQSFVLP